MDSNGVTAASGIDKKGVLTLVIDAEVAKLKSMESETLKSFNEAIGKLQVEVAVATASATAAGAASGSTDGGPADNNDAADEANKDENTVVLSCMTVAPSASQVRNAWMADKIAAFVEVEIGKFTGVLMGQSMDKAAGLQVRLRKKVVRFRRGRSDQKRPVRHDFDYSLYLWPERTDGEPWTSSAEWLSDVVCRACDWAEGGECVS